MVIEKKYFVLSKNILGKGYTIIVPNQGFKYNHDSVYKNNKSRFESNGSAFVSWDKYGIYSSNNGYPKWAENEVSPFSYKKSQFDFFQKINYNHLNARQKENYNFHKAASRFAEYGYNCMWLNDDWQGADFIAVHVSGENFLKVQLKGRFTIDKKYIDKEIWICYVENGVTNLFDHDTVINNITKNIYNSKSWIENGKYTWNKTPIRYNDFIFKI